MTEKRKLELIAEALDLEIGDITPGTVLDSLDEWDSIAAISFIAMMDDEFGKTVKGTDLKELKTISELMELMEEE